MKKKKRKIDLNLHELNLLNIDLLRRYTSGDGKAARIVSRFATGFPARHQRELTRAIKRARQLNLM